MRRRHGCRCAGEPTVHRSGEPTGYRALIGDALRDAYGPVLVLPRVTVLSGPRGPARRVATAIEYGGALQE